MMSVMHRTLLGVAAAVALAPIACLGAGYVGAVAVQGDYAYVGINRSIVVVDVSDPRRPTPVGQTSFWPDNLHWFVEDVSAISVDGDHACVVYNLGSYSGRTHSMVIVDVSRPAAPKVITSYDISGWPPPSGHALGVTASGQYAYLYHSTGLDVVDVSKPMEPTRVGRWNSHGSPSYGSIVRGPFVAIAGNYAYVAGRGGLRVLDISDPTDPKEVGSCPSVHCESVALFGKLAFVMGGPDIIDISDPKSPKVIDTYRRRRRPTRRATMGAFAAGNYVFLYGSDYGGWGYPERRPGHLPVVDISDPSAPKEVSATRPSLLDDAVTGVSVAGNYAYMGVGPRLVVVDISDPEHLSVMGSAEVLPCKLTDVAVAGDHAFLASGRGRLRVLDISDAGSPKEVSSFRTPAAIATVTVAGNYAFAGEQDVLHVLDASDPKDLREVAPYRIERSAPKADDEDIKELTIAGLVPEFPPCAPEVAIVHNYACLAVDGKILKILDISDPNVPKELGSYEEVPARRVAAYGDHVLVLYEHGAGLGVVDLSPLAWTARMPYLVAIALVTSVGLALLMFWVRRSLNRYLLLLALSVVALPPALLTLVPKAPRVVSRYHPPGASPVWQGGLAVAKRHAYIVGARCDDQGSMLWVLDVSNPASPREMGSCKLSQRGHALDVAVAGKYAYVVDDSHALYVVNVTNPAAPKVIGSYSASIHTSDPQAVAVTGQHVLVTDGHWGMRVFDVSDPASPKPVCFYDSPLGP